MRVIAIAAIFCALVLAGCGGGAPAATATPVPPTEAPTNPPVEVGENQLATLAATSGVSVPVPGTLVVPTLPPGATAAPATVITNLSFTRSGGLVGAAPLTIFLLGDGTVQRNGEAAGKISAEQVNGIATMLDQIRFYDLEGIFTAPGGSADTYKYTLTVTTTERSRTLISQDGMTPPELFTVYNAIIDLATANDASATAEAS